MQIISEHKPSCPCCPDSLLPEPNFPQCWRNKLWWLWSWAAWHLCGRFAHTKCCENQSDRCGGEKSWEQAARSGILYPSVQQGEPGRGGQVPDQPLLPAHHGVWEHERSAGNLVRSWEEQAWEDELEEDSSRELQGRDGPGLQKMCSTSTITGSCKVTIAFMFSKYQSSHKQYSTQPSDYNKTRQSFVKNICLLFHCQ